MSIYDFETSEFEKLKAFLQGIKSDETDKEKLELYFKQHSFENTQSINSYTNTTSSAIDRRANNENSL